MGNKKEEKWVIAYNKYKTMDFDKVIRRNKEESAEKEEKGQDTSKLSVKISKFKRIKENLPKIENLKNYLDKLKEQKDKLEAQKKLIDNLKAAPDKMKDMEGKLSAIEAENKKLEEEIKVIDVALKVNKDNPEEKAKLEEKRKNLMKEYGDNQTKYSKYQDIYTSNRSLLEAHAGQKLPSSEEVDKKLADVNKDIDKCNIICSGLIDGKNMAEIMPTLQERYEKDSSENQPRENQENEVEESEVEENTSAKITLRDRFMSFLAKHPKVASFVNRITGNRFTPELNSAEERDEQTDENVEHDEEEVTSAPDDKSNSFRDDLRVEEKPEEVNGKKPEVKDNTEILQNQLLEAIAEYGEKSDKAQKIASQIKLQKYVQEKSGVTIGTKSDASRYETEQYQALPENSKMKEALAGQDKIAVGRAYLPKENDDEGR